MATGITLALSQSGGFVRAESIGQNRVSMIAHVVREWWAWCRCNFVLLVNATIARVQTY